MFTAAFVTIAKTWEQSKCPKSEGKGRRRRQQQKMRWLDGITSSVDVDLGKFQEVVRGREVWCAPALGVAKSWHDLATEKQPQNINNQQEPTVEQRELYSIFCNTL